MICFDLLSDIIDSVAIDTIDIDNCHTVESNATKGQTSQHYNQYLP